MWIISAILIKTKGGNCMFLFNKNKEEHKKVVLHFDAVADEYIKSIDIAQQKAEQLRATLQEVKQLAVELGKLS